MISTRPALWLTLFAAPFALTAQQSGDSLSLAALQNAAVQHDPRSASIALLQSQSALRLRIIASELRPSVTFDSYAQYQSDVARFPSLAPGGLGPLPLPLPHDTYDARLIARQSIYDPSLNARRSVEFAQLAESQSRVRSTTYSLRQAVNDAFFSAAGAQQRIAELETSVTDLESQLDVASARIKEGTALPSELYAIRAELLRRRQTIAQWDATRLASLSVLNNLTGRAVDTSVRLRTPDVDAEFAVPVTGAANTRGRPEFESFRASRELLARQREARAAQDKPRISAYGRAGYGQPGLNPLGTRFDSYWLAGVQLQWSPWTGGTVGRDRQITELQSRIVESEEAAFTAALERQSAHDIAQITRLKIALSSDDEIIALREKIAAEFAARYREGMVTSAEYVDRQTDVLSARLARAQHQVELAETGARVVNTLGLERR